MRVCGSSFSVVYSYSHIEGTVMHNDVPISTVSGMHQTGCMKNIYWRAEI